jgi:hypothetical protein
MAKKSSWPRSHRGSCPEQERAERRLKNRERLQRAAGSFVLGRVGALDACPSDVPFLLGGIAC